MKTIYLKFILVFVLTIGAVSYSTALELCSERDECNEEGAGLFIPLQMKVIMLNSNHSVIIKKNLL